MISFEEAQQIIINEAKSFGKEIVSIDDAYGRVLSEVVYADRDYPPFNRSAMDGIAIQFSDWEKGIKEYTVVETIYAGNESKNILQSGECYKIMTGAAVPSSADTVIRREDVEEKDDKVKLLLDEIRIFQNISRKGEDIKEAEVIINKPIKCSVAVMGLLASLGKSNIIVERLPKVVIITTGDEVVDVATPVSAVQIRNSNVHVLKSLLRSWNILPSSCEHVIDDKELLQDAISKQLTNDILIMSGAVSAGDADFVPQILEKLGAKKIFHKVAIRPGKPIWFGKFENGPIVFALPGNPFSCTVTFKLFIELFLLHSFGLKELYPLQLPMSAERIKKTNLDEFFPVKIKGNSASVEPLLFNGSGDVTAAFEADAIAQHPKEVLELKTGAIVRVYKLV